MAHAVQTPCITIGSPADAVVNELMEPVSRELLQERVLADLCGRPGCALHRASLDLRPESVLSVAEELLSRAGADAPVLSQPPAAATQPGSVGWAPFSG
jgi:hypothetical protein